MCRYEAGGTDKKDGVTESQELESESGPCAHHCVTGPASFLPELFLLCKKTVILFFGVV